MFLKKISLPLLVSFCLALALLATSFELERASAQTANTSISALQEQIASLLAMVAQLQELLQQQGTSEQTTTNIFAPGDAVTTTSVVNVRSTPGGAPIAAQKQGESGTVVKGPQYANAYTWWYVQYSNGVQGWSAQDWLQKEKTISASTNKTSQNSIQKRNSLDSKLGLVIGPNAINKVINEIDFGSWYYTYNPNPDNKDKGIKTFEWSVKNNVEFVPMVIAQNFVFADRTTCPLAWSDNPCSVDRIADALRALKKRYADAGGIIPSYIMGFNEPGGNPDLKDINESVKAWARLQKAATQAGFTLVSPNIAQEAVMLDWYVDFLKSCYDDSLQGGDCDIEKIKVIALHQYRCEDGYWDKLLGSNSSQSLKNKLIRALDEYKGFDWDSYIEDQKIWLTETSCNWDSDFLAAQQKGQFIRENALSCQRASGQVPGYGSLEPLMNMDDDEVERIAWWTTYADYQNDTDGSAVTESSKDRIQAARLFDDNAELTPIGKAVRAAFFDLDDLTDDDLCVVDVPTCTITASPSSVPDTGGSVTFTWKAQHNTAGSLWGAGQPPNPVAAGNGSYTMFVKPKTQTLQVWGTGGEALCTVVVKEKAVEEEEEEEELGTYSRQFGDSIGTTKDITRADALADCKSRAADALFDDVTCTWNGNIIYSHKASDEEEEIVSPSCTISASPSSVPASGGTVKFSWNAKNTGGASLWGAGQPPNPFGGGSDSHSMFVKPKTQILQVWGPGGDATCQVVIKRS